MGCGIVNEIFCEPINENPKRDKYDPYADEIKKINTELMKLLWQLL